MGSDFMNQFLAGWKMGQGRNENTRRDQELMLAQQQQQEDLARRAQEFELRKEDYAARKKALAAEEALDRSNAAKEAYELRSQAQSFQNVAPPTAQDIGIQQTTPQDVGPTLDQINVPQPMMDIPNPQEGQAPIQMPVLTGRQQLEMAAAEQQKKMRDALFLKQIGQKTPQELEDEEYAKARGRRRGDPPQGPREPQGTWTEAVGPGGKPVLFNSATGQVREYPEGVQPKPKGVRVTGAQQKAFKFYEQMADALGNVERPIGTDPKSPTLEKAIAKSGTAKQWWMGVAAPALLSPEQRQYMQAAKLFTESRLRNVSGAAVPPYEYKTDLETYFVQPGDDDKTIEQKRRSRQTVLNALKKEAGPAYTEFYGGDTPVETAIDPAVEEALKELGF